jgi:prepilin-type N-terminal cleavage/methylation domain-containing protein
MIYKYKTKSLHACLRRHTQTGFTLVEILVVLAIIALLAGIIMPSLSGFHNQQALRNTTEDMLSLLNEARSDTLGSLNATDYSVLIQSNQATYFIGDTFSSTDPSNKTITFDQAVAVSPTTGINLNGGGTTVTFDRLTGGTSEYGTIIIGLVSDPTQQKMITISQTGLISSN